MKNRHLSLSHDEIETLSNALVTTIQKYAEVRDQAASIQENEVYSILNEKIKHLQKLLEDISNGIKDV